MIENLKNFLKKSFSNGPKAKIIMAVSVCLLVGATVTISLRKTVTVTIDGIEETFVTYRGTVDDVLESRGITLEEKDKIQPSLDSKVSENEAIAIKRAVPVNLLVSGRELKIETAEDTILDMLKAEVESLKAEGVEYVDGTDEVSLPLDTKISKDLQVQLVKVEYEEITEKKVLAYDTVTQKDESQYTSYNKVTQAGENGEEEVTYRVTKKDGVETSRDVVKSTVLVKPVNAIKTIGSKTLSRGGESVNPKRTLSMTATAYSPDCVGGGKTATGTYPRRDPNGTSTIAVDPSVIPLGTLVYIEGYGYARAEDTGGAIKGNIIDVFVNSLREATSWGRRSVTVHIL